MDYEKKYKEAIARAWDSEKKELRKIEQKTAWSEEDEEMINDIISNIHYAEKHRLVTGSRDSENEQVNWLKSIKERMKGE